MTRCWTQVLGIVCTAHGANLVFPTIAAAISTGKICGRVLRFDGVELISKSTEEKSS